MPDYFDEEGRSLRRFFLQSPLKFDPRITSRYSLRRMHPVLQTARAHRGVDYDSYYLHLSAFAPGVRRGARVAQGQTIGTVRSTGMATGPHLHYGLQKNGAWVDPPREHRNMPPGDPVPAAAMDAFRVARAEALAQIDAVTQEKTPLVATAGGSN